MTTNTHTSDIKNGISRQTGFSLAAGPVIWALHMAIVYPVTSLTCEWGWFPAEILGMPGLRFFQLAVTAVAAAIVGVAGLLALREWRALREPASDQEPDAALSPFMAMLGVLSNALFLLAILVAIVPILTLAPCAV